MSILYNYLIYVEILHRIFTACSAILSAISRETPHGFNENLVIQHEMADFCTLTYFRARLKWNIT